MTWQVHVLKFRESLALQSPSSHSAHAKRCLCVEEPFITFNPGPIEAASVSMHRVTHRVTICLCCVDQASAIACPPLLHRARTRPRTCR